MADDELVVQLKDDYGQASLSAADMAILAYVAKLTQTPSRVGQEDLDSLREAGLSDRAILDVAQITGYFAFVTRLANGLGVTLERYWA